MRKHSAEQLVSMAFKADKRCIGDDLMLLSWVWAKEKEDDHNSPLFYKKVGEIFTHLLKCSHPATIFRVAREILAKDLLLKESYEPTDKLKREILEKQPALPFEEGKARIKQIRKMMDAA